MELLFTILIYWIAVYNIGRVLPLLGEAFVYLISRLWYLIPQLCYLLFMVLKYVSIGAFWICVQTGKGAKPILIFLYYLADEALRSEPQEEEEDEDWQEEWDEEEPAPDPYETALMLLGLRSSCTEKEFSLAYKRAIARAHPDKGGTDEQAQSINIARETVKRHNDWR